MKLTLDVRHRFDLGAKRQSQVRLLRQHLRYRRGCGRVGTRGGRTSKIPEGGETGWYVRGGYHRWTLVISTSASKWDTEGRYRRGIPKGDTEGGYRKGIPKGDTAGGELHMRRERVHV